MLKYHVLSITPGEGGSRMASGIVFAKTGDQLDRHGEIGEDELENILTQLPKRSRILVVLDGDQVLSRFSDDRNSDLFGEIDQEDFYMQQSHSKEGWMIQSACRKSLVDPLIELFSEKAHFLVDVSLGPVAIPELEAHIDQAVFFSSHMCIEFKEHQLRISEQIGHEEGLQEGSEEIAVSGMTFSTGNLTLLGAFLRFFAGGSAGIESLKMNSSESTYYRLFQRIGLGILALFFVLLLINFLLFGQMQSKLDGMKASGDNLADQIEQIEKLKKQISEYRQLTNRHAVQAQETYSYYLEETAQAKPSGVWFNQLRIYPLIKKQERNKQLQFDRASFLLYGETNNPVSLNKLINILEEKSWVEDIELINYEALTDKPGAGFALAIKKGE